MLKEKKVNKIGRKIGVTLIKSGSEILQKSFHLEPFEYPKKNLENFLEYVPSVSFSDKKYYLISLPEWKKIIKNDWLKEKQYLTDKYDCDNFAFSFASRMAELFSINSCGVAYGTIYDRATEKELSGHAYNMIMMIEDKTPKPYLYEPMTGQFTEFGQGVSLGDWIYQTHWILFY